MLMDTISIRNLEFKNRIVMLATHLGYCDDGIVDERIIRFYQERAKFRPGLIIVGGCYTEHLGMSSPTMIGLSEEKHLPGLKALVDCIHAFDVPVAAQLYHAGRYAHSIVLNEESVSASAVLCRLTRETPRALSIEEIQTTITNYGVAAARAKDAGFDAVEILGSAGYLINQFMARATNIREDEYGGILENRARFAVEVVRSVRKAVGDDFTALYRISGEDFVEDGITLEENKTIVKWLVEAGVDVIDVTGGWHETRTPQITMDVPRGHYAYLAEAIAESVDVPVIACNRINSSRIAERILERGKVQLIGMSRGLIADAELPEKIRENRSEEIRTCIACNLGCLDKVFKMEPVICAINPLAGLELEREISKNGKGSIAVVGAGPAGLETARVLKIRGFDVTLFERDRTPGGLLKLGARIPGRGELAAYPSYMLRELRRLGVDLRFETKVNTETISSMSFDCVVCATGTIAGAPAIDGVENQNVLSSYEVIENQPGDLGKVAILGGSALGCYTGLFVSSRAESVHIFLDNDEIGIDLGRTSRWIIMNAIKERNIEIHKDTPISQILNNYLMYADDNSTLFTVDTVIIATEPQPRNRLAEKLKRNGVRVESVGSVIGTKGLLEIVHQAFEFANNLSIK